MSFLTPDDHKRVRSLASLARAATGTGASRIQLFATLQPPQAGGDPAGEPLVEILLAPAVGTVSAAGVITLQQADSLGDLIAFNGAVVWGRWLARDGALMGDGDASGETGSGFFKLAGTTGTQLYAGARAVLGVTHIV